MTVATPAGAVSWMSKLCQGFSSCNAQGLGNAGYQNEYLVSHWGMTAGHNCTNYAAYRLIKNGVDASYLRGQGMAWQWGGVARNHGVTVDTSPRVGDIAWFGANASSGIGAAGHVAFVESVNASNGTVTVSEDNYGGDFDWRPYHISDVTGFIHFGGTTPPPPPPPSDRDGDGVPDASDLCPDETGLGAEAGCQESAVQTPPYSKTDFNGDGTADYCRVVGGPPSGFHVACSMGGAGQFSQTATSDALDVGYRNSYAWADATGDGRADYCRLVGGGPAPFQLRCTRSLGTHFGDDFLSGAADPGYPQGRAWVDFNGDGKVDYCRVTGVANDQHVQCTLSTGGGFGSVVSSPALDWGYEWSRSWTDVNGDGRTDYCRVVGGGPSPFFMACTLSHGSSFGTTWTSGAIDVGYAQGRAWADVNADGRADYCRVVGTPQAGTTSVRCTLLTPAGFGGDITSGTIDWGYDWGRWWPDVNGDGRADYCRAAGDQTSQRIICNTSTGSGFSAATMTLGPGDWGYQWGRGWADANGDGKADYCRVVGIATDKHVLCTFSTGTGFAGGTMSAFLDWGYDWGRMWPSGGTSTSQRVRPWAPRAVHATGGVGRATVGWAAPSVVGGSVIRRYQVFVSPGGRVVTVGASARIATITGLATGRAYRFAVRAANANAASTLPSATVMGSSLTAVRSAASVPRGRRVAVGGVLRTSAGRALAGRSVRLFARAAGSSRYVLVRAARTTTAGRYRFSVSIGSTTTYRVQATGGPGWLGCWSRGTLVRSVAPMGAVR